MKSTNKENDLDFYAAYIELTGNKEYFFYKQRDLRPRELAIKQSVTYENPVTYYTKAEEPRASFFPPALQPEHKVVTDVPPIYTHAPASK